MMIKNLVLATSLLILINLLFVNLVVASPNYYTIDLKVLPETIYENNEVLVFGYVGLSDWSKVLDSTNLTISVLNGTQLISEYYINDINYFNDLGRDDLLVDGFFYKGLALNSGDYTVLVKVGGVTKAYKQFTVLTGSSNLTLSLIDVVQTTDSITPIISLNNSHTGSGNNVSIRFFGRSNFNNPQVLTAYVSTLDSYSIPEGQGIFNSNLFVDSSDKVYGLVVIANGTPGYTNAKVKIINQQTEAVSSGAVTGTLSSIKLNTAAEVALSLTNNGVIRSGYNLVASGSLAPYVQLNPQSIELSAGQSAQVTMTITLPKTYSGGSDLKVNLLSEGVLVDDLSFNPTLVPADPEHKIVFSSIDFNEDYYFTGDSISGTFVLTNTGDYAESFWLDYTIEGMDYKEFVSLSRGASRTFSFFSPGVESVGQVSISLSASNDYFSAQDSSSVAISEKVYSFNSQLDAYELIVNGTNTESVELFITNTGNVLDRYLVTCDYSNVVISSRTLLVEPGDSETVTLTITPPSKFDIVDVKFTISSQWSDNELSEDHQLTMYVFQDNTPSGTSSIVDVEDNDVSASASEGAVFSFNIKNNGLTTNSYSVDFESGFANLITTYPEGGFTVSPGSSKEVIVYVAPASAGSYSTDYIVYENGLELSSGSLELTVTEDLGFGLTGFTVAAGGFAGIAGLALLIVFVYFFLKRSPRKKAADFKPLEIKKADLGKPKIKDAGQYW